MSLDVEGRDDLLHRIGKEVIYKSHKKHVEEMAGWEETPLTTGRNNKLLPCGMNSRSLRYPATPSHQINSASILAARSVALTSRGRLKRLARLTRRLLSWPPSQQLQAPAVIIMTAASKTVLRAMRLLSANEDGYED
jgi:hypothetical protein